MSTREIVQRVRIYISERDRWEGQPLHLAVLERLRREGATGATALRGLAGFGPGHRTRLTSTFDMSEHPPVVLEWVDRVDRVAHTLPLLDDLLVNALITIEDVAVYRAVLRSSGPFASECSARDFMHPAPQTLSPAAALGEALLVLIRDSQRTVPILDAHKRVVGIITERDIGRRTGLQLPLHLFPLLTSDERSALLEPIASRPVIEVMSTDIRSVYIGAAIPQALAILMEWNYDQIPVLDRDGALVGLLGRADVLRAAIEQHASSGGTVRDTDPPTPVSLVMQTAVPRVAVSQSLAVALRHLAVEIEHYLIVVDAASRVQGAISAESVVRSLHGADRAAFLAALQPEGAVDIAALPGSDRDLEEVVMRNIATISPNTPLIEATRYLLEHQLERAPVVDEEGKLLGLISRGGILRALVQASE